MESKDERNTGLEPVHRAGFISACAQSLNGA
jgi:hypothetical protein